MKKLITALAGMLTFSIIAAQQIPISEGYFIDRYSFSPSYAGNYNPQFLFLDYRSDWTGINGGPKTFRMSYNDRFMTNSGYGAKLILDKAGIFNQLYFMGSYSYNLKVSEDHHILFGLSAGVYRNTINMREYYNDPTYNIDPSLISENINSKIKFMSDASVVWLWKGLEAGFMFSNINFGDAHYKEVDVKYKPLSNFQFHADYYWTVGERWDVEPFAIVRGGKYILSQFEFATRVLYQKKLWGSLVYRDPGIFGVGLGCNIGEAFIINYNFNFASNVALNVFTNHEFCLGINIFKLASKKQSTGEL